jgi:hypothetical protein
MIRQRPAAIGRDPATFAQRAPRREARPLAVSCSVA